MSSALAISAVTTVLQYLLVGSYSELTTTVGGITVSAVAPDIVQTVLGTAPNSPLQVNVFLHQVTHNSAWRNECLPSLGADGTTQITSPPLALDLHYMLTAYAGSDTEAEALLGYAILMLHLNPVLIRSQIQAALEPANIPSTNPLASVLAASGLSQQIETIKIVPAVLGREEIAWLWTALKADYRPTYAFQASVVLIQPQLSTSPGLPVLMRSISAIGQPSSQFGIQFAQLTSVQLPAGQSATIQGASLTVTGTGLATAVGVMLTNTRLGINDYPMVGLSATPTATSLAFNVPTDGNGIPAGVYDLSVVYVDSSGAQQTTNALPLAIAPIIATAPPPSVVANASGVLVTVACTPNVQAGQNVSLALNATAVPPETFTAPAGMLSFQFPSMAAQQYLVRLLVDGVSSLLDITLTPPAFTGPFITVP